MSNWCGLVPLVKQFNRAKEVFDILCRYGDNGNWRKIGDFYEKASLLEWKTSAVTATSFAFDSLTNTNEVIGSCDKGSSRFIYYGEQKVMVGKNCLPRDFDNLFLEKNAQRISKFFDTLAPSSGETVSATGVQLMRPGAAVKTV